MILNVNDTDYVRCRDAVRSRISGKSMKAYVMTFGCQQNEADSETIRGILTDMGYTVSSDYSECDVIILNTCAIREHAEAKVFSMLGNFKPLKQQKPWLIVGVVGCMAAESGVIERLKRNFHYVTFTLEPNMLHKLPSVIDNAYPEDERSFVFGEDKGDIYEGKPTLRDGGCRAWVSVMYGCNNFCSYCIVPYVRGRERSRSSEVILNECRELIRDGVREITLLGQNVNSYNAEMSFPELLESIAGLEGDFLVRFMTSHPKDASPELIEVMRRHRGKIAPSFHLPLQSGSDRILKKMNRTYDRARYLSLIKDLREAIPDISLSTDIIVGFPGETDEDFDMTMDIIESVRFDMVYSFIYSKREGTVAARMTDEFVPREKSAERMKRLLDAQKEISHEKNAPYEGKCVRVLCEGIAKRGTENTYVGRTDTNKSVKFTSDSGRIGEFVTVKINRAGASDLFGEQI